MDNNEHGTNLAEVGTDCISRQAVITQLSHNKNKGDDEWELAVENDIQTVWQLPPIQPKRGKWERHYSRPNVLADLFWHCSECGYKDSENYAPVYHHFCTNCGADMRQKGESSESN